MDERSVDRRDLPMAGTALTELVLSMRSRCFREATLFELGIWATGGTGRGKVGWGRVSCGSKSSRAVEGSGDPGILSNVVGYLLSLDDRRRDI